MGRTRISGRYTNIPDTTGQSSPTLEMMERIAAGLGVSVQDMVDFNAIERRMDKRGATSQSYQKIVSEYNG